MAQVPATSYESTSLGDVAEFTIPFPFLSRAEVFVTVDGASVPFTWINDGLVQLSAVPELGAVVRRYRSTAAYVPLHQFSTGVPFLPRYVDRDFKQTLYAVQESVNDTANTSALALATAEQALTAVQDSFDILSERTQYIVLGPYGPGLNFQTTSQVFSYGGEFYAPSAALVLPYTTTGIGAAEIANFRSVGDAVLRADLAGPAGASYVAFTQTGTGAVPVTVQSKLSESVNVKDFGATGNGVTDDTAAVAAAITAAAGRRLLFTPGTYVISSIGVTTSVNIECAPGVVLKRKANADITDGSMYAPGAAMFEVSVNGTTFAVSDFTYDGNSANQPATAPTGLFFRTQPAAIVGTSPIIVDIQRGVFINGTSGYILLRGDNVSRRYETYARIADCKFYDTLHGRGKGDPSVPAALGYLPTYVYVLDFVRCTTLNFHAEFNKPTGTGEYAATALNGTFFGSVYADSGESFIWLHGTTYIKNMGRSAKRYDGANDWVTNNGIGAIDCYGNADTLFIEHLVADNCQNVPMRAKGSTKNFTLLKGVLTNCHRGVQVGPSTTGACETVAYIGAFKATGGTIPQLEFVGSSAIDRLLSVKVESAYISGALTNPESRVNEGVIRFRNVNFAQIENSYIASAPIRGLEFTDVSVSLADGLVIDSCVSGPAVVVQGGVNSTIANFKITNAEATAIALQNNPAITTVRNGYIENSGNYGVFSNNTTTHLTVENVASVTVTGTGRAFYAGGGDVAFIRNKSSGATTPLFVVSGTNKREDHNSWNPVIQYATAAPTTGAWKVGDLTYNTAPVASGTIGWVCTVAGTPGTWKTFGAVSA